MYLAEVMSIARPYATMPTLVGDVTIVMRGSSSLARNSAVPSTEPLSQMRISEVESEVTLSTFWTHCRKSGSRSLVKTTIAIDMTCSTVASA